jgi:hypothetical protein
MTTCISPRYINYNDEDIYTTKEDIESEYFDTFDSYEKEDLYIIIKNVKIFFIEEYFKFTQIREDLRRKAPRRPSIKTNDNKNIYEENTDDGVLIYVNNHIADNDKRRKPPPKPNEKNEKNITIRRQPPKPDYHKKFDTDEMNEYNKQYIKELYKEGMI